MTDAPLPLGDLAPWALDPGVVHLNHGSFAAVPTTILDLADARRREVERDPLAFYDRIWDERLDAVLEHVAGFLGAPVGSLALLENATAGIDLAFATLRLGPGDVVVTTDHGYPAVDANLAQRGVTQRVAGVDLDASDDELLLATAERLEGASALVVDEISSSTGRRHPTARLCALAREAGVPIVVDAAHAPGQLPVDLEALDPDFWFGNFHKWACAPKAVAGFYAAQRWHERVPTPMPSSNTAARPQYPGNARWHGTRDVGAWAVLPEVLELATWFLRPEVRARNVTLAADGAATVAAAIDGDVVDLPRVQMALVPLGIAGDGAAAWALRRRISREARAATSVTVFRGELHLRLSAHVYSRIEDYQALAQRLPAVLARGPG